MRDFVQVVKRVALNAFRRNVLTLRFLLRSPACKPALTVDQRLRRFKWAKQNVEWSKEQMSQVMSSEGTQIASVSYERSMNVTRSVTYKAHTSLAGVPL